MSRKKDVTVQLSSSENEQVQKLFTEYQQVVSRLYESQRQAEVEGVLSEFNALSESAQLALLKLLAKERGVAAADFLVAVNALSPLKEIRKEARRALLRLEAAHITPQWTPPIIHSSAIEVKVANPPRFWKGWASQSREEGEMHLVLTWEQGYDYSEAHIFAFLLDFWQGGIKDCFEEVGSKRHIEAHQAEMRSRLTDVAAVDCSAAEGKRLLEEALSVNVWRETQPEQTFRNNLPLLNRLLLQNSELGEEGHHTFINPELEPEEVAINFIGAWSMGDYGLAYDLLAQNSPQREGLNQDEWVELRRAWADESHPARLELGFAHEREQSQSGLWLPSFTSGRATSRKEIELGWSLEMNETLLSGTLKEMPMGTAINKETSRHWFWTSYTLVQEQGAWRIQTISDEGARAQGLPIAELQKRIEEHEETVKAIMQQHKPDEQAFVEEVSRRLAQTLHYYDALMALLPLDSQINEQAYTLSLTAANPERTLVYVERMAQRFPHTHRADTLRTVGATLTMLAYKYDVPELEARRQHLLARAESVLQEAVEADHSANSYLLLAELYLSLERNDEAESLLLTARAGGPEKRNETAIEAGLGNLAMRRERVPEALAHFQRVAELDPDYPAIWFNLGFAQRLQGNFEQAETCYQRAIQTDPDDERPYSELIAIAMNNGEKQKARAIAEKGIRNNPDSARLYALLASVLQEMGDPRGAAQQLARAEALDPQSDLVQSVRQHLRTAKKR